MIFRFIYKWITMFLLVTMVVMSSGCAFVLTPDLSSAIDPVAEAAPIPPHQVDVKAQAMLAFVQFRMYGSQGRWDDALAAIMRAGHLDPESVYLKLLLARVYLHLEQTEMAVDLLTSLLESSPENFDVHLLLGDIYLTERRNVQALHHFHLALAVNPDDEALHLRLAMVFLHLDQVGDAQATLEQFIQRQPDAHQAILSLARIYRDSNQLIAARKTYSRYLEKLPGKQQVTIELGRLLEPQDSDAAIKLYLQTLEFDPYAAAVRQQLVQLYLVRQQPEEALQQLLILRKQFPQLQDGRQIGLLYLQLNRWEQAEKEFHALLSAGQITQRDRYYLALALVGSQRSSDAIFQLEQITAEADIYKEAMLQLAYLYQQQSDFESAYALLDRLLEQDYKEPDIYYYLVAFQHENGHLEQALAIASAATQIYPEDPRLLYQLGLLYNALDNQQHAFEIMEAVLEIDDQHADALNFIAYALAEAGADLPLALERAKRALELKSVGYIEDTVGWVYFKLGNYQKSHEYLERASALHPEDPIILEHLGDVLRKMSRYQDAAEIYRKIINLEPNTVGAADKLEQLYQEGKL